MKAVILLCVLALAAGAQATSEPDPSPPNPASTVYGLVEALKDEGLGTLYAAINAADPSVKALLSCPSLKATVFAPTDNAFVAVLKKLGLSADALLADQATLTRILFTHVVRNAISTRNVSLRRPLYVSSLVDGWAGQLRLRKGTDGAVKVLSRGNSVPGNTVEAKVILANVEAARSLVQVIDWVLLPGPEKVN